MTAVTIRRMTPADIPAVVAIEQASLSPAWPESAYRRELAENALAHYLVAVAEAEAAAADDHEPAHWWSRMLAGARTPPERVVGFLGLWMMVDEAHIVTVAVDPAARRHGVGVRLVLHALALAQERQAQTVLLECRVSNTPAQRLYEKLGFRRAGIRKRYYNDNNEDALIMTTPPLDDAAFGAHIAAQRQALAPSETAAG